MKAILISIKPEWLAKVLNGEKTVEIRKSCPQDIPNDGIDVYLYCTKSSPKIYSCHCGSDGTYYGTMEYLRREIWGEDIGDKNSDYTECLNGKVVAVFRLKRADEIVHIIEGVMADPDYEYSLNDNNTFSISELLARAGLETPPEIEKYVLCSKKAYAWHIDDLEIFDKPMELKEFYGRKVYPIGSPKTPILYPLDKAPQSWQYVEIENAN